MNQAPADYIIYKGKAAIQFTLKPGKPSSRRTERGEYVGTEKGCIFIAGANARGLRDYDWDHKVTIGLNEHEVGKILHALKGKEQKFYHDTNKGTDREGEMVKNLSISPSNDQKKLFINLSQTIKGVETKINGVPIEPEEAETLHALLCAAIPRILGWII